MNPINVICELLRTRCSGDQPRLSRWPMKLNSWAVSVTQLSRYATITSHPWCLANNVTLTTLHRQHDLPTNNAHADPFCDPLSSDALCLEGAYLSPRSRFLLRDLDRSLSERLAFTCSSLTRSLSARRSSTTFYQCGEKKFRWRGKLPHQLNSAAVSKLGKNKSQMASWW